MYLVLLRTIFIFIVIVFALRIMGKKQLGELQPSELVTTILVSNLASIAIESPELPIWSSIIPVFVIVAFEILLSCISLKFNKASKVISGNPRIIIAKGKIDQKTLYNLRFTVNDLLESLRAKDVFEIDEVDFAIIETSGSMSVRKKENSNADTQKGKIPSLPVVTDGTICKSNLSYCGIDENFINYICQRNNCKLEEVLLLMCNDVKKITLIKKERQ